MRSWEDGPHPPRKALARGQGRSRWRRAAGQDSQMGSGSPSKPVQFGEAAFSLAPTGMRWLRPAPWAPSQDWPSRLGAGGASFKLRRPKSLHILALPNYAGPFRVLGPARGPAGLAESPRRPRVSILGVSEHFPSTRHPSQPRRPVPSGPLGPRALL